MKQRKYTREVTINYECGIFKQFVFSNNSKILLANEVLTKVNENLDKHLVKEIVISGLKSERE